MGQAVFVGPLEEGMVPLARRLAACGLEVTSVNAPDTHAALTAAGVEHKAWADTLHLPSDLSVVVAGGLSPPTSTPNPPSEVVDIGSQGLVRAAANQYDVCIVVTDPADYVWVGERAAAAAAAAGGGGGGGGGVGGTGAAEVVISQSQRKKLAVKALRAAATLDLQSAELLAKDLQIAESQVGVLVVGSGGREHAIADKLAKSARVQHVFVAPGNGGTAHGCDKISNESTLGVTDYAGIVAFCKDPSKAIGLVVVGPEVPLVGGLADALLAQGIPCFGPSAAAARLEASKAFSKDFMAEHGIRTARYKNFSCSDSDSNNAAGGGFEAAKAYVESIDFPVVVKASGLAAGKGVLMPEGKEQTLAALKQVMVDRVFGAAGDEVVVEELLIGEEVSILALCDGTTAKCMPGAQDHKRALDGDKGVNTGGMGAYAPAPCLTPALQRECASICQRTVTAMAESGSPFVGVLFAGFMLTADGPVVLEFNVRMGDPETQVVLPLLRSDLYDIFSACTEGRLAETEVSFLDASAATVVMAAGGYPGSYPKGMPISGIQDASSQEGVSVFHAGTKLSSEGGGDGVEAAGGRVLAVTGCGSDFREALDRAYAGVKCISFSPSHFRTDIGHRAKHAPLRVGVLASGRGTALQPVLDAIKAGQINAKVVTAISNKSDAFVLERCEGAGIPSSFVSGKGRTRADFDEEVSTILSDAGVDLVLLIGYMRILSPKFCQTWAGRCMNVHPSLLPDFAGGMDLEVHAAVVADGRKESGCTIHFVTEEVDGGPIIVQSKVAVTETETAESLKAKVQAKEGEAFLEAIARFQRGEVGAPAAAATAAAAAAAAAEGGGGGGGGVSYKSAGVDIDAGNALVERIKPACKSTVRAGCDADLGGFGGLFDLAAAGYETANTILVGATDGVGTKLKVAQIAGKHTGVGVDLVAMCVNDLIVAGAEPLFFLDYYATGRLSVTEAAQVVEGIAEGCRQANCGLIGGETAEMPSMYADGDYDLAGFSVGAVDRTRVLPKTSELTAGDVVLGLRSSGVHSNGFSLVRKIVELERLAYSDPAPFDKTQSLADALLVPTRIYVRALLPLLKAGVVKAMAHITGGGLLENVPRVLPAHLKAVVEVESSGWKLAPVFGWLRDAGKMSQEEMLRTLNCGVGMCVVVAADRQAEALELLREAGEADVLVLGGLEGREDGDDAPQVVMKGTVR